MSQATVSFYVGADTRYVTGLLIERHPDHRVTVETTDGERVTGLRVPDHLAAVTEGTEQ